MIMKLEDKLTTMVESATTSLSPLTEWLKVNEFYTSNVKDFESMFDDFIEELYDEIEEPEPSGGVLREDYADINDIFNDNFDISRQLDNLYDRIEEENGQEKADEHIETLNNEFSALKSQFLAHLVELQEFMLVITEDLN